MAVVAGEGEGVGVAVDVGAGVEVAAGSVGEGDSCPNNAAVGARIIKKAKLTNFVISSEIEANVRHNSASSHLGKGCRAIRNLPKTVRRYCRQ